jgi:hypothetical protein
VESQLHIFSGVLEGITESVGGALKIVLVVTSQPMALSTSLPQVCVAALVMMLGLLPMTGRVESSVFVWTLSVAALTAGFGSSG